MTTGTYYKSDNKKHDTLIVFVSYMGGTSDRLKYHIEFLNQNGFDVYTYPAFLHGKDHWKDFFPAIKTHKAGVLETWTEELRQHLNHLPGEKAIFGFSFPSSAVFPIIHERADIKALICDGGPFLNFPLAAWRFFTYHQRTNNIFLKIYLTAKICRAFRFLSTMKIIKKSLPLIPKNFPVLSLQAERDRLVPPSSINKLLKKMKQASLTVCRLKHSAHLEGLKKDKKFYMENVLNFLEKADRK